MTFSVENIPSEVWKNQFKAVVANLLAVWFCVDPLHCRPFECQLTRLNQMPTSIYCISSSHLGQHIDRCFWFWYSGVILQPCDAKWLITYAIYICYLTTFYPRLPQSQKSPLHILIVAACCHLFTLEAQNRAEAVLESSWCAKYPAFDRKRAGSFHIKLFNMNELLCNYMTSATYSKPIQVLDHDSPTCARHLFPCLVLNDVHSQ